MFSNLVSHRLADVRTCAWAAIVVVFLFCPVLSGQESADSKEKSVLDLAVAHSRLTGKPIFAVAGRSTWPPCVALLKRLNTEEELTRYQGQVVPIKLDISTPEYKSFRAKHPAVGKTIPKIFVVRADGETMFAKATSLPGDTLFELLEATVRHGGRILSEREIVMLTQVHQKMVDLNENGDVPGAVSQLKYLRKVGTSGEFDSFAEPAIKLEQLVGEMTVQGRESLKPISNLLEQDDQSDEAKLVAGLNHYLAMTDQYRGLKTLREEFNHINKTISRDKNLRALFSDVKTIEKSQTVRTEDAMKRAIEKLDAIVAQRKKGPLSEQAKKLSDQLKTKLGE